MADRGSHRGGGRGGGGYRGGRGGGGRGGGGDRGGGQGSGGDRERPKKENILDLSKYMDKQITVKFNGGREGENMKPLVPSPFPLSLCSFGVVHVLDPAHISTPSHRYT